MTQAFVPAAAAPVAPAPRLADALPEALVADITARAAARDANRELPFDTVDALRQSRFGALRLPVAKGGFGASWRQTLDQVIRLATADSNVAHIWRNHLLLTERLAVHGPDTPTLRRLTRDVAGGALIGLAAAETGDGSPVQREGGNFRFTAVKKYSTGTIYADWIVSYGVLDTGERLNLVIPRDRDGITIVDDWNGMGQRLTGTGTTRFEGVKLNRDEVLFPDELAPDLMFYTSTVAQLVLTAVIAGITAAVARDGRALLAARAGNRSFYYAPSETPTEDPLLLAALGHRSAEAFAARAIVLEAADALDAASHAFATGGDTHAAATEAAIAAAKAKAVIDELAQKSASALFDIAGASATVRDLNLDRHWRNLRTVASHNPAVYKAFVIGDHEVNAAPVPSQGLF